MEQINAFAGTFRSMSSDVLSLKCAQPSHPLFRQFAMLLSTSFASGCCLKIRIMVLRSCHLAFRIYSIVQYVLPL